MTPRGIIALWHRPIAAIPNGWTLCDGTHGTPDLRSRFIIGAGSTYDPRDTGGEFTHTHTFTGDGHQHTLPAGDDIEGGTGRSATSSNIPATGTTDAKFTLPPFYALYYIMRT